MKLSLIAIVVAMVAVGPAWADHRTRTVSDDAQALVEEPPVNEPTSSVLDVEIKLGKEGFRLGGRLFGSGGVKGAWINGQIKSNGFVLDGRVQDEHGHAQNFKVDAQVSDWLAGLGWQLLLGGALAP